MEKKFYVKPILRTIDLESGSILNGSPGASAPDMPFGDEESAQGTQEYKGMWDGDRGIWK